MFNKIKPQSDEDKPEKVSFFRKRSFHYGSMATVFTVFFIAIVILINIVVSYLSTRFPISIDMTSNKDFQVSSDTLSFLKKVNAKVTITVLADETAYLGSSDYAACAKIMDQYPQYNSDISIRYVDLDKNPSFASNYPKESLSYADIIVSSGSRYKHIAYSDLLETSTDSSTGESSVSGNQTEQQIDSAIEYVTSQDLPTIMFTSGHDEQSSTGLQDLLKKNNYTIETKNISTDGLDSKASTVVITDPKNDFSSAEIKKLDDFLTNGGQYGKNLVVYFDPQETTLPNIEDYVREWGIKVGTGLVYDKTNNYSNYFIPIEGSYDTATVGNLASDVHAEVANPRPLTLLFDTKDSLTTTTVLSTMASSQLWNPPAVTSSAAASFQPNKNDKAGPFIIMAKSEKKATDSAGNVVRSNVMVSGSYAMINDTLLSYSNISNATIMVNTFNSLNNAKTTISIVPKFNSAATLTITGGQKAFIEFLFVGIIPILVLILGLVVWLRRRHQ